MWLAFFDALKIYSFVCLCVCMPSSQSWRPRPSRSMAVRVPWGTPLKKSLSTFRYTTFFCPRMQFCVPRGFCVHSCGAFKGHVMGTFPQEQDPHNIGSYRSRIKGSFSKVPEESYTMIKLNAKCLCWQELELYAEVFARATLLFRNS